jgi:hypothetical protein
MSLSPSVGVLKDISPSLYADKVEGYELSHATWALASQLEAEQVAIAIENGADTSLVAHGDAGRGIILGDQFSGLAVKSHAGVELAF